MQMKRIIAYLALAVIGALMFVSCVAVSGAVAVYGTKANIVRTEPHVTKMDSTGRIEVMKLDVRKGACIASISYEKLPKIDLIVVTLGRADLLGTVVLNEPKQPLSNTDVRWVLTEALLKCPLITPRSDVEIEVERRSK